MISLSKGVLGPHERWTRKHSALGPLRGRRQERISRAVTGETPVKPKGRDGRGSGRDFRPNPRPLTCKRKEGSRARTDRGTEGRGDGDVRREQSMRAYGREGFGRLASMTAREYLPVVLSHQFMVLCYGSLRKLMHCLPTVLRLWLGALGRRTVQHEHQRYSCGRLSVNLAPLRGF